MRKYEPFIVVEGSADKLSGSAGFNDVTGLVYLQDFLCAPFLFVWMTFIIDRYYLSRYIFGKNSKMEKIPMTTPVFTEASNSERSNVSIQVVLPLDKDMNR